MKTLSVTLVTGVLSIAALGTAQAQCRPGSENTSIPESTASTDFRDGGDGTVTHIPTGLTWQRCVLGQTWTGSGCTGTPQLFTWQDGLLAAQSHLQDQQSDWRMPNRNELSSIVEDRCFLPAMNELVFPDAPAGLQWTSSPVANQSGQAWSIDFDDGTVGALTTGQQNPVRLVRSDRRVP